MQLAEFLEKNKTVILKKITLNVNNLKDVFKDIIKEKNNKPTKFNG